MKVNEVETIRLGRFPNLLWVHVRTDEGLTGLGETFGGAAAVEAYIHESVAPYLLGEDPLRIEAHSRALTGYYGFRSNGAETRGNSAIDIALWDILGQATGQPLYQLLGGLSRERVRIYNTCAGYGYVREAPVGGMDIRWGLPEQAAGPYEDLDAFLHRADELAYSLLSEGITGMKIWPFDPYGKRSGGMRITSREMRIALEPFEKIRRAVGHDIDIMVEFHSLWDLPTALRIASALEEYEPYWFEDPIRMGNLGTLGAFARRTRVPVCASETLSSRWVFRELLETSNIGVLSLDISWVGGVTEAKKIADMADTYHLPVAPHDCTGPVVLTASVHLSASAPNALVQETVRAFYSTWYRDVVTELPEIRQGEILPLRGPGLGTRLLPGLDRLPDAVVRRS